MADAVAERTESVDAPTFYFGVLVLGTSAPIPIHKHATLVQKVTQGAHAGAYKFFLRPALGCTLVIYLHESHFSPPLTPHADRPLPVDKSLTHWPHALNAHLSILDRTILITNPKQLVDGTRLRYVLPDDLSIGKHFGT